MIVLLLHFLLPKDYRLSSSLDVLDEPDVLDESDEVCVLDEDEHEEVDGDGCLPPLA